MPADLPRFETQGMTWAERAKSGELGAVLAPTGSEARNRLLHASNLFGARTILRRARRHEGRPQTMVDFGCGTGRFIRFFGARGFNVIGTDITADMLAEARRFGLPAGSEVFLTDGVHIPAADASVDLVWVCGVLKYTLFVNPYQEFILQESPVYPRVASEMHRVLKPGGLVANLEMYVNVQPELFIPAFEDAGFETKDIRVLYRNDGAPELFLRKEKLPIRIATIGAKLSAAFRYAFDDPRRPGTGLRDYLFVWQKRG